MKSLDLKKLAAIAAMGLVVLLGTSQAGFGQGNRDGQKQDRKADKHQDKADEERAKAEQRRQAAWTKRNTRIVTTRNTRVVGGT